MAAKSGQGGNSAKDGKKIEKDFSEVETMKKAILVLSVDSEGGDSPLPGVHLCL